MAAAWPSGVFAKESDLVGAYNAAGFDLFKRLSATSGNVAFSPYSVGTAMAMALSAARGATEAEMAKVLRQTLPRSAMADENARVLAALNDYDKSAVPPQCPTGMTLNGGQCKGPKPADGGCAFPARLEADQCTAPPKYAPSAKLAVANSLMLTKAGDKISADYIALLKSKFGAEVFRDAGLSDVNSWVKRKTEGKIEKILEVLDPSAKAVLLNAVYFKAAWLSVFDKRSTSDEDFNLAGAGKIRVPTMHRTGTYAVAMRPEFRAIRMPYVVPSLGMIIVVPEKTDGFGAFAAQFDAAKFAALRTALQSQRVELALPRFKISSSFDLIPAFQAAGMKLAFSDKADFSGMTGRPAAEGSLKIGQIAHRAVVEVDETGTEAAAATAIVMMPTAAMPSKPVPFKVDRPFLFYLVDDATGAVLFQGRINDPR
jgi:serpin B